jgi:hypothetical protein
MVAALCLDEWGKAIIYSELDQFEKYYLPPFPLKNKKVLDLGACCGETAYFYLQHGAGFGTKVSELISTLPLGVNVQ